MVNTTMKSRNNQYFKNLIKNPKVKYERVDILSRKENSKSLKLIKGTHAPDELMK